MGVHCHKIDKNVFPELSPASKTPQDPSPELSHGPSALIVADGSRHGHPEAPGGPKGRKRRFEHLFLPPGLRPLISVRMVALDLTSIYGETLSD